ncbi:MAG: hypothetical protein CSB06_01295 [Bacteroidia bacterium]|nr:MAG: hypothetical protein CSB06_01295 [Bacteroidia bacterium]
MLLIFRIPVLLHPNIRLSINFFIVYKNKKQVYKTIHTIFYHKNNLPDQTKEVLNNKNAVPND